MTTLRKGSNTKNVTILRFQFVLIKKLYTQKVLENVKKGEMVMYHLRARTSSCLIKKFIHATF